MSAPAATLSREEAADPPAAAAAAAPATAAEAAAEGAAAGEDALSGAMSSLRLGRALASTPQRLHCVILDMNGLLLDRRRERCAELPPPDLVYGNKHLTSHVFLRPHARSFVDFALARFRVGVWSSAQTRNLTPLVDFVFGARSPQLAFTWAQDKCGRDGSVQLPGRKAGNTKPKFLKELQKVYDAGLGEPDRTLLIDDDTYKAARNAPHTALHPAAYTVAQRDTDNALAEGGALRGFLERLADAPSVPDFVRDNPLPQT
jgi:hypothetical protein